MCLDKMRDTNLCEKWIVYMYFHSRDQYSYSRIKSKVLPNSSCQKQGGGFACSKQDLLVASFEAVNPTRILSWPCFRRTHRRNCAYQYICKAFLKLTMHCLLSLFCSDGHAVLWRVPAVEAGAISHRYHLPVPQPYLHGGYPALSQLPQQKGEKIHRISHTKVAGI